MRDRIFLLCQYQVRNLTALFLGVLLAEQGISIGVEYLVWGETFRHWLDSVFLIALSAAYFYYIHQLGDVLLALSLKANNKES